MIRIGTSGQQTEAFIAGIANSTVTGAAVYVTPSGQLGVLSSSEHYKTAIAPMGEDTEKLQQLRPVSFHLKSGSQGCSPIRSHRRGSGKGLSGASDSRCVRQNPRGSL